MNVENPKQCHLLRHLLPPRQWNTKWRPLHNSRLIFQFPIDRQIPYPDDLFFLVHMLCMCYNSSHLMKKKKGAGDGF